MDNGAYAVNPNAERVEGTLAILIFIQFLSQSKP